MNQGRELKTVVRCVAAIALCGAVFAVAAAGPFDCKRHECGLPEDGFYPKIVVGTLLAVATREQAIGVLDGAHKHGWWAAVPEGNSDEYLNSVALVAIQSTQAVPLTVMMTPQELAGAPLSPGDLVRYTPHLAGHERPSYNGPHAETYYALTGCVAVLCSASDKPCFRRYRAGIYRLSDGVEVGLEGDAPVPGGARIDPQTILPVSSAAPAATPKD